MQMNRSFAMDAFRISTFKKLFPVFISMIALTTLSVSAEAGGKYGRAWVYALDDYNNLNTPYEAQSETSFIEGYESLSSRPFRRYFSNTNITITRTGTGRYRVRLIGMETTGGTVHVTGFGHENICKVQNWYRSGSDQYINVRCYNPSGALSNAYFSLNYTAIDNVSKYTNQAYLWAGNPTSASYNAHSTYSRNSSGGTNHITRLSRGEYRVTLPGVHNISYYPEQGGTVMVTAYGSDAKRCKVKSWSFSGNDANVNVRCFTNSGSLSDSRFTLSFVKEMGSYGARVSEDTLIGAYGWVNTTPNISNYYQFNTYGGPTTVTKLRTGRYQVEFDNIEDLANSSAIVTAYGSNSNYCVLNGLGIDYTISNNALVFVSCYNSSGSYSDSKFTIQFLTDDSILF